MGLFTYARVSPTRPKNLSPTTWHSCWTSLQGIISKWTMICGVGCLWVRYHADWYRRSHCCFDCKEGDTKLNPFKNKDYVLWQWWYPWIIIDVILLTTRHTLSIHKVTIYVLWVCILGARWPLCCKFCTQSLGIVAICIERNAYGTLNLKHHCHAPFAFPLLLLFSLLPVFPLLDMVLVLFVVLVNMLALLVVVLG